MTKKKILTAANAKRLRLTPVVVDLVAKGWSTNEIATHLDIYRTTVIRWLNRIGADHPSRANVSKGASNIERIQFGMGEKEPETGCVPWTRGTDDGGYGIVRPAGGRPHMGAHRLLLEMKLGRELGLDEVTRHTCDNPACVNPDHLLVGTQGDNVRDMCSRRRGQSQVRYDSARQTTLRARAFALLDDGRSTRSVAEEVGVAPQTIRNWRNK